MEKMKMIKFVWKIFYTKGTVNFGNGSFDAKRNKLTGTITLLLSNDTMNQMFKATDNE